MDKLLRGRLRVRRVVTGFNDAGESTVIADTTIDSKRGGRCGYQHAPIWATDTLPVELPEGINETNSDTEDGGDLVVDDPSTWSIGTCVPGGSAFRIVRYAPKVQKRWHQTDSIDYGIVLSGNLWLQLEDDEVQLHAGDVIVQRSTIHNWQNRGDEPCLVAFVLIATDDAA